MLLWGQPFITKKLVRFYRGKMVCWVCLFTNTSCGACIILNHLEVVRSGCLFQDDGQLGQNKGIIYVLITNIQ